MKSGVGVVGAIGAINPKSGTLFPDFVEQWHAIGLPECEWDVCMGQHIVHADASQAMPRASSARGVASSATMTAMARRRRIDARLAHGLPQSPFGV